MTLPEHQSFGVDDRAPAAATVLRSGIEPWRIAVSVAIVFIVVAAVWLWGRPHPQPPQALAAVTVEAWLAGQPPGAFETLEIPQEMAGLLAEVDSIADSIAAFDVPAGTFITPALLGSLDDLADARTVMRFSADTSAWPEPGPQAGSRAVVAGVLGGCALDVTTLSGGAEGSIVVRVDRPKAARYARVAELDGLVVWPAPPDGWPECRPASTGIVVPAGYPHDALDELGVEPPAPAALTAPAGG